MKVYLCLPHPTADAVNKLALRWTTQHSASSYGNGVLLDSFGRPFDGQAFLRLRVAAGAWLEAEDMDRVRSSLGLPPGERIGFGAESR